MIPVFVGESTVDLIVDVEQEEEPSPHRAFERTDLDGDGWVAYLANVVADRPYQAHPGGSVANVAAAFMATETDAPHAVFSVIQQARSARVSWPLWWEGYDIGTADLTARGLRVVGHDAFPRPQAPGAVALVNPHGVVVRLVVNGQQWRPVVRSSGTLLVSRTDHLRRLGTEYLRSFAGVGLLLADDDCDWDIAATVVREPQRFWVFGSVDQVSAFEAGLGGAIHDGVVLVGTSAAQPCMVRQSGRQWTLPVAVRSDILTDLGAGDAYMGGFLARAVRGGTLTQCHAGGCATAVTSLMSRGARSSVTADLNEILPDIDRVSSGATEASLFQTIRRSPGVTLITGGQTGVDSIATEGGWRTGLPTHVIFPAGRRREDGGLDPTQASRFGRARLHELASSSFRYRTWATVYYSDAVLLVDTAAGEGSAETRKAAVHFNRPLLDVDNDDTEPDAIADWLNAHEVRVVLVAGNRASLLAASNTMASAACRVDAIIDGIRLANARRLHAGESEPLPAAPVRLGVTPRISEWLDRLGGRLGPAGAAGPAGLADCERVVLGARDLVTALARQELPAVLTWPSLVPDEVLARVGCVPLGCFSVHYGLALNKLRRSRQMRVAVQYSLAFARHARDVLAPCEPFDIEGSAETWLSGQLADAAYDSYHTGATIATFGLHHFFPTHWESLCLLWRNSMA